MKKTDIRPDLIPISSWGSSLANLLTRTSWDSIRRPILTAAGTCQICHGTTLLECHEIWAYAMPPPSAPDDTVGVQRLLGLAALCKDCHAMFHMGRARRIGTFQLVKQRLMQVNEWRETEFAAYENEQKNFGIQRAGVNWALDLSRLAGSPPLIINSNWTLHEESYLLGPIGHSGEPGFSVILGVSHRVSGKTVSAIPAAQAMEGLCSEQGDFFFAERMNRLQAG